MWIRSGWPLLVLTLLTGCDALGSLGKSKAKDETSQDDDDDKSEKKKNRKRKKGGAESAEATTSAKGTVSPPPTATPAGGPATVFTGDPDPTIKFERQNQIPNKPVWIQRVPNWKANTDRPSDEEPWTDLSLTGKEDHATIHLWVQKRNPKGLSDNDIKNNCAWAHVTDARFDAPIAGSIGQGLSAQIAVGTGQMAKKPTKIWWMVSPLKGDDDLAVFVAVRPDVYPKLEAETVAMMRSLKVSGP